MVVDVEDVTVGDFEDMDFVAITGDPMKCLVE